MTKWHIQARELFNTAALRYMPASGHKQPSCTSFFSTHWLFYSLTISLFASFLSRGSAGIPTESYVITGPVFAPSIAQSLSIGPGKVHVPTYLFKLVYDQDKNKAWAHWHLNDDATRGAKPITDTAIWGLGSNGTQNMVKVW